MAAKIVVIGDINGRFSEAFSKLAGLQAKQSFAFAIVAGNLFTDATTASLQSDQDELAQLLQGTIVVPFPTYFSLGSRGLPAEASKQLSENYGELCPNLTLLGRKVSVKTSEGIKLVAIGGKYSQTTDDPMSKLVAAYNDRDVESAKDFLEADILITSDWPAEVQDGSKSILPDQAPQGVKSLGELCSTLKPRYHFSTSTSFYEREPFFHTGSSPRRVTRFISLAPFGNTSKQKWIYAFSLDPSAPSNLDSATASPFTSRPKRKMETPNDESQDFRFAKTNGRHGGDDPGYRRRKRHRAVPPPTPRECYFCLSNPACETHMIGSIGDNAYLTIAKGPLSTPSTFGGLNHPCHILIIPLYHAPTFTSMSEEDSPGSTLAEMQRYREALNTMVAAKSTDSEGKAQLGAVTWEISRGGGVHLHWQFLPVPVDMIQQNLIEVAFEVEAENLSYPKFVKTADGKAEVERGDYFKAMIWSETQQKEIVMPLDGSFRFDLQFGRRVLGKLLGLESRTHWRDCEQSQPEEEADANAFKEAFKGYDFSLEE